MINGLNTDYYDLTGLREINVDNITATGNIDTGTLENSEGSYFSGITSNIQDQLNSLSGLIQYGSSNSNYDSLIALKSNINDPVFTGIVSIPTLKITDSILGSYYLITALDIILNNKITDPAINNDECTGDTPTDWVITTNYGGTNIYTGNGLGSGLYSYSLPTAITQYLGLQCYGSDDAITLTQDITIINDGTYILTFYAAPRTNTYNILQKYSIYLGSTTLFLDQTFSSSLNEFILLTSNEFIITISGIYQLQVCTYKIDVDENDSTILFTNFVLSSVSVPVGDEGTYKSVNIPLLTTTTCTLNGVDLASKLLTLAPINNSTFTGTLNLPSTTNLDGVDLVTQIASLAPLDNPFFTGTVHLPDTYINNISLSSRLFTDTITINNLNTKTTNQSFSASTTTFSNIVAIPSTLNITGVANIKGLNVYNTLMTLSSSIKTINNNITTINANITTANTNITTLNNTDSYYGAYLKSLSGSIFGTYNTLNTAITALINTDLYYGTYLQSLSGSINYILNTSNTSNSNNTYYDLYLTSLSSSISAINKTYSSTGGTYSLVAEANGYITSKFFSWGAAAITSITKNYGFYMYNSDSLIGFGLTFGTAHTTTNLDVALYQITSGNAVLIYTITMPKNTYAVYLQGLNIVLEGGTNYNLKCTTTVANFTTAMRATLTFSTSSSSTFNNYYSTLSDGIISDIYNNLTNVNTNNQNYFNYFNNIIFNSISGLFVNEYNINTDIKTAFGGLSSLSGYVSFLLNNSTFNDMTILKDITLNSVYDNETSHLNTFTLTNTDMQYLAGCGVDYSATYSDWLFNFNLYNTLKLLFSQISKLNGTSNGSDGSDGGTGTSGVGGIDGAVIGNVVNGVVSAGIGAAGAAGFSALAGSIATIQGEIATITSDLIILNSDILYLDGEVSKIDLKTFFLNTNIFNSYLQITGPLTGTIGNFNSGLNCASDCNIIGNLNLQGSQYCASTLSVMGNLNVNSTANLSTLQVYNKSSFSDTIRCSNSIYTNNGFVSFNQYTIGIDNYGSTNLRGDTNINATCNIYKNLNVAQKFQVQGNTYNNSNVYIAGDTVIKKTLLIGDIDTYTLNNVSCNIYGALNINGNTQINGSLTINNNLLVYGNIYCTGQIYSGINF